VRLFAACLIIAALLGDGHADEDPDLILARGHFRKGEVFYDAGDYTRALAEFQAALSIKQLGQFHFNIAVCEERLGRRRAAIADYRAFIATSVDQDAVADVNARIARLEVGLRHPERWAAPITLTVVAVGAAAAGAGLVGAVAHELPGLRDQFRATPTQAIVDRAHTLETRADLGYAMFGVAGAAAVAGIVTWALAAKARR
jgi:tetratricopeptide (TPR) repeat protein